MPGRCSEVLNNAAAACVQQEQQWINMLGVLHHSCTLQKSSVKHTLHCDRECQRNTNHNSISSAVTTGPKVLTARIWTRRAP